VQNCGKKEEEEEGVGRKGGSDSEFVTPGAASRKKRKLFTNTPQNSQVAEQRPLTPGRGSGSAWIRFKMATLDPESKVRLCI